MNLLPQYEGTYHDILNRYDTPSHLPGLPILLWYLEERENIRRKREDLKHEPPWTKDPILDKFYFTNIYREDDRVSRELYEAVVQEAPVGVTPNLLMFNAVAFRTFNIRDPYLTLGNNRFITRWNEKAVMDRMDARRIMDKPMFGSAYIIAPLIKGQPKHKFYVKLLSQIWKDRSKITRAIIKSNSLEETTKIFKQYTGYGGFLGYELALDMQMIGIIPEPVDQYTWANPGPGARRGLNHVYGRKRLYPLSTAQALEEMRELFDIVLIDADMRLVENGLCESSKYFNVLSTGRAKRKYKKKPSK